MKYEEKKTEQKKAVPQQRGEKRDEGPLESLGKAISSPIAGAAEDDLLPTEDAPRQQHDSKRP